MKGFIGAGFGERVDSTSATHPSHLNVEFLKLKIVSHKIVLLFFQKYCYQLFFKLFQSVDNAIELLQLLTAVQKSEDKQTYTITELGRKMAAFPVDPRMSKALIAAHANKCL